MTDLGNTHKYVLELFGHRCVRCKKPATAVHEMVPRSKGHVAYVIENMVPLCPGCHDWAHRIGTRASAKLLEQDRLDFLSR